MGSVFYAYRDSSQRRDALAAPRGAAERYLLFGAPELGERGWSVTHNLEAAGSPPAWARSVGGLTKAALERSGGYGGDFTTVFGSLRRANRTDVILSTVDTVGIPLMLSKRARLVRPSLVYVAIGLPERLARLESGRMRRLYARSLAGCATILAYSEYEAEELERWLAAHGAPRTARFVPFGVDERAFAQSNVPPELDVVSVGADPHRDFELLLRVASRMPRRSFGLVVTADRARELGPMPANVVLEVDLPLDEMRRRLAAARVVALPVLDNSYSGATTVLLQALSLGKPVVVSNTKAIAGGYGLVDGENSRLVEPGDDHAFERALGEVLRDEWHARALGAQARRIVEERFTWERFVDQLEAVLREAVRPA